MPDDLEPLDQGDDDYPDVDGLSFPELVQLREVMEWRNAEADAAGDPLPHPEVGVPPPTDPGERGSTPLVSRAGWGARAPVCRSTNIRPEGITVHWNGPSPWTGVDRSSPERFQATADHARCASIWRAIQAFHIDSRGFCDIAYTSCGGCPHGVRFEGRGPGVRTGAQGTNDGNLRSYGCQALIGVGDPLTDASKAAFHDEATRLGVPLRWGHQAWKSTQCPGPFVVPWWQAGFPAPAAAPQPEEDDMKAIELIADGRAVTLIVGGGTIPFDSNARRTAVREVFSSLDVETVRTEQGTFDWIVRRLNEVPLGKVLAAIKGIDIDADVTLDAGDVTAIADAISDSVGPAVARAIGEKLTA